MLSPFERCSATLNLTPRVSVTLMAFMRFVIYGRLRPSSNIVEWVDWTDGYTAVAGIAVLGVLLTLVPTLVMTRKYLKV